MAEAKVLSGAGLRGQVAGQTALSTVGQAGAGLTYRGYDVRELANDCRVRRSRLPAVVRRAANPGRAGRLQAQAQGPA